MVPYQISLEPELVQGLLTRNDGVALLVQSILNQVLQAQVAEHLHASPYEQTPERTGYRNGSRDREFTTRVGTVLLQIPKLRSGTFTTDLLERYKRSEQALVAAMVQMVIEGVSTRKVDAVVEELCGAHASKSLVSSLCERLDPLVKEWNERSLSKRRFPFVVADAIVIRIRVNGRVVQQSVLIATGINEEGFREILGLMIGDSESETTWSLFFSQLKTRGLRGVDLVISDQHAGLRKAIATHFQGAVWQRCQTHLSRNVLDLCPKAEQPGLKKLLRELYEAADEQAARTKLRQIEEQFEKKAPRAVAILEDAFEDATAVLTLPEPLRKRLRTTNLQERLNEEIRRRERVIRIFPNAASAKRLIGALLLEWDEVWSTNYCFLNTGLYYEWKDATAAGPQPGS
jgi:transposase-like protein